MIVEEITVRNWRSYREPHTFRFGEGFNLLVGRNEAGKSTLFEAFTRVLFDRHTSTAEKIREIQPLGSSLGPEATIVFQANGNRYKIWKRFLKASASEFFTWRGDCWELDHEGDEADKEVREILQGETPSGASQPKHRGLCQALWYLQDDAPLPEEAWAEGVNEGLSGIVSLAAKSPEEDRILKKIEGMYSAIYTPKTGDYSAKSDHALLQKEIQGLEEELQTLHERARRVEDLRLELEDFAEQQRLKGAALKAARAEVADLTRKLKEGAALEEEKNQKDEILRRAKEAREKLAGALAAIDKRIMKIDELNRDLEEKQREVDLLQADARIEERTADAHHETWKTVHEPELRRVEKELCILQAIERIRQFEVELARVLEEIYHIETTEAEFRKRQEELTTTPLPRKKDLKTYQDQKLELATINGQIEQAAIRIGFDLQVENISITAEPDVERLTEDGEYLVLGPTAFTIGDLGTITVRGGGSSLEELQTKAESLSTEITSIFERFGAADEQELSDLQQRRQDLEQEIKRLKKILEDLTSKKGLDQLKEDVARTRQKITDERSKLSAAPPGWQDLSGDAIREMSEDLARKKEELNKKIEHEQDKETEVRTALVEASRKAQKASSRLIELKTEIRALVRANGETLKSYGTYENLQATLAKEAATLKEAEEDFADLLDKYRIQVEEPRAQHEEALETLKGLEEQMQSVEKEIVDRNARIEEAVSKDFYSSTGDLEALLDVKRRKLDQVITQAEAVKLLREMVQAFKKERSTALSGPVAGLMNRWLLMLTSGSYDSIQMDENLFPIGILNPLYDETLPLKCLSYGTHEQVIVLLRLAIGVLLSNSERNLVVIDDRLVNADSTRMRRLCQILEEVATNHCQVLVATCNDTPYAGVRGKVIPVPGDGRAE
ncbi:MAG: SMC family ATPase [Candidatus Methanomethylophilaceae archaeon]|nr:SMC family ATPase [Candidatus Methanomethylophilaceae archaeon]